MPLYESEITVFLKKLKEQQPHLEEAQREGRALLWDRDPLSPDEAARAQAAKVPQKPYVYQTD